MKANFCLRDHINNKDLEMQEIAKFLNFREAKVDFAMRRQETYTDAYSGGVTSDGVGYFSSMT